MLEALRKSTSVTKNGKEDDTLIILYDMGYDTGRYSHIKVQYGLVDARTVQSAISDEDGGYQRILNSKRIIDITSDFHWARLNPITICIRKDGNRYNVDGQARVSSVRTLYRKGEISSLMIPCVILTNTTLEDEAMLFGTQDDGKTQLRENQKVKIRYKNNNKTYTYNGTTKTNTYVKNTVFITVQNEVANSEGKEILIQTNASRASLVQYHNGGKGINRQSFLKMKTNS